MRSMASQITSLTIVYSTVYLVADQRKHQISASLAFVRVIRRGRGIPRKMASNAKNNSFDDVIMIERSHCSVGEWFVGGKRLPQIALWVYRRYFILVFVAAKVLH